MEQQYADVDELITGDMPQGDVQLKRGLVRIRGLSRGEVLGMQTLKAKGIITEAGHWERLLIHKAMVQPRMSEKQVGAWQDTDLAGGDLEDLTNAISALSGMDDDAEKKAMSDFRGGPDDGIRVLPGDQAGDDGSEPSPPTQQ